jgi:outer membrane protein W
MAKKGLLVLVLAAVAAGGAFALPDFRISAGGGGILVPSFGEMKPKGGGDSQKSSGFGGGLNLFFDATYAEVNLGLIFANQKSDENDDKGTDTTSLTIGVVGKYPFSLGEKLSLFPFVGIDYNINLAASYDGEEIKDQGDFKKADYFNALSLLFGIGVDYSLTEALYLRGEVGFGITFNTKYEDDMKDFIDSNFKGKVPIKLAVGYRF